MRTNRYTGSATDAGVGYGKVILTFQNEAGIGINSRPFQKSLMLFALFLRDRFVPMFLFGNPGAYFFKFFRDVFVNQYLFVHVEIGQPVVNHFYCVDIVELCSGFSGHIVSYFHSTAFSVAICENGEPVIGFQLCFLDEMANHIWGRVSVYGVYQTYLIGFELEFLVLHELWNA